MLCYSLIRYEMDGIKDPRSIKNFYYNILKNNLTKLDSIYSWVYDLTKKERYNIGLELHYFDDMNTYMRTIPWSTKEERIQYVILHVINRKGVLHFRINPTLPSGTRSTTINRRFDIRTVIFDSNDE